MSMQTREMCGGDRPTEQKSAADKNHARSANEPGPSCPSSVAKHATGYVASYASTPIAKYTTPSGTAKSAWPLSSSSWSPHGASRKPRLAGLRAQAHGVKGLQSLRSRLSSTRILRHHGKSEGSSERFQSQSFMNASCSYLRSFFSFEKKQ